MQKLTTTIKREWLKEIAAGRKPIEYREIKPYWEKKLASLTLPFQLRLINGMSKKAPEVTVLVRRVVRNHRRREFELHIGGGCCKELGCEARTTSVIRETVMRLVAKVSQSGRLECRSSTVI